MRLIGSLTLWIVLSLSSAIGEAGQTPWFQGFEGDPQTVGRGGSGLALPDTFFGSLQNPAGSSFIVPRFLYQQSKDSILDLSRPDGSQNLTVKSGGLVAPLWSWGVAMGTVNYNYGTTTSINEYTLSGSHRFLEDHLAVGAGIVYGNDGQEGVFGTSLGALYRFPQRMFLGASVQSALNYSAAGIIHPWTGGIAFGQMPNRVFRYEGGIRMIGTAAQPYAGTEYQFIDLHLLKMFLFGGSYLEDVRVHGTFGSEINAWIFSLEGALDVANGYSNYLIGFSVDLGRLLKVVRVVPPAVSAPSEGLFPNPFEVREDWFPAHLQDDPENSFHEIPPTARQVIQRITHPEVLLKDDSHILENQNEDLKEDMQEFKKGGPDH